MSHPPKVDQLDRNIPKCPPFGSAQGRLLCKKRQGLPSPVNFGSQAAGTTKRSDDLGQGQTALQSYFSKTTSAFLARACPVL